ncbi:PEPxxWA-CTERM sorting domain-containing protein [Duganella violaceipulchra]|uniref:PEPxxWA-CTERM sorting domain-containing protein n=1 Tax=Duganella violaceipulchra TaxID=2849652 RepID=A0AA41H4M6_9BURK|nr:PEPxxWA-CTERM sorting domain-containing protein [Duganella violaceicalia]MBV6319664.1 PEPxxWA-CTERM sorting domain-containing protein [Duganella violaceicalia]MCP2006524.1 hypothetical protein [Duganella violaceicalia]
MNKIIRLLACAGLLAASAAAQAASYQFSYHFLDGEVLSGSFDGNANGNLITDLSNISISVNGAAFGGGTHFYSFGVDGSYVDGAGLASFDGKANQFLFVNADVIHGGVPTHSLVSGAFNGSQTDALGFYDAIAGVGYGEGDGGDPYAAARWSVTAVPEPATYAMLLGGLALTGALARRRKLA